MLVYKGLCACEQITPHVFVWKWKNTPHSSPHNQQSVGGVKQTHTCTHGPVYINWTAAVIWHRHTTVCNLLQTQTCPKDILAAGMENKVQLQYLVSQTEVVRRLSKKQV